MDEDFLKKFDKIESLTDESVMRFEAAIPKSNDEILDEIKMFVGKLDKDSSGNIKPTVSNLKAIDKYSLTFDKFLTEKSEYAKAAKAFIGTLSASSGLIHEYFNSPFLNTEKGIYQAIINDAEKSAIATLLGSGVNVNFTESITAILKDSVVTGSDTSYVLKSLQKAIKGDTERLGGLERYSKQVANDLITQFNSAYMARISDDLGLTHSYYKGTKIRDTRPICDRLAGKYFKDEDLKAIIDKESQGKGWSGMIPGTNWGNFSINRGGYHCRHYKLPITEAVYNAGVKSQII